MLENYKTSYAQNHEDVIIEAFFSDVKNGYYVDVGANDPVDDSVTYIFYQNGWTGINIEPNKDLYEKLQQERPRDTNLHIGVSAKKTELVLRQYTNHGLSTFSNKVKEDYTHTSSSKTDKYEDVSVPIDSLAAILKKHTKKHIHFMKIDVEGYEYEVISSNDWAVYRPELLCIEANHIIKDWRPLLEEARYRLVFNDGLNNYYLAEESKDRLKKFDYAAALLLGKPVISPGIAKIITEYEHLIDLKPLVRELQLELVAEHENLLQVTKQRNELFSRIEQYQGVKRQLRMLLIESYGKILVKIDNISKPRRMRTAPELDLSGTDKTRAGLLQAMTKYDQDNLTEHRLIGGWFRRLVSRLLKAIVLRTAHTAKFMAKLFIKGLKKLKG